MRSLLISLSLTVMCGPAFASEPPPSLSCMGTEPFWNARIEMDGAVTISDGMSLGEDMSAELVSAEVANGRLSTPYLYRFEGETDGFLIIDQYACSDGMSDNFYDWRAFISLDDAESGHRFQEGCCSILE